MKKIIFILLVVFISFLIYSGSKEYGGNYGGGVASAVRIAGQNIKVELALTPEEQAQGLSGRQGLNNDEGMLFVFENSGIYPFWMKDMNFAIDIIWISEEKKVIYIKKDARPEDYPQSYNPESQALYVLEVVSGFSEKNNLKIGDRVEVGL